MRNSFEHFDERLDDWYATSTGRNHLDYMIGAPSMISGMADTDMFRVFDPSTAELVFWGKRTATRPARLVGLVVLISPRLVAFGSGSPGYTFDIPEPTATDRAPRSPW